MTGKKILVSLSLLLPFLGFWEFVSYFPHLQFVLPAPSAIGLNLWEMADRFWFHTQFTLKEMLCGFSLAFTAAFPLAWLMLRLPNSRTFFQPFFILTQCIPMFTLAPLMVIWFGWGFTAIVVPTALMIFFPLTLSLYQGLIGTPKELLEFFQTHQATAWQTFYKLRLPWALPHLFSGLKISAATAGVGAIAGEWAGAQNGLGILMLESRRNADLEITFGALMCLTTISILLYSLILLCEKILNSNLRRHFPRLSFRPKTQIAFSLLASAIILSGCQSTEKNPPVRLLLDWLPNPNHVPLYVGLKKGYFQEEGIHLEILKNHECAGIPHLTANNVDLLINHMPGTFKACSKGAPLKIVGFLIKEPLCGLTYRSDPSIKNTVDLSNRVFGYCMGVPELDFIEFLLQQGNIHPREKKNISVDLVTAMATSSVDFIYGGFWNIEPAQLESIGLKTKTFKIQELGVPTYYEMIVLAKANSSCASPDFIFRFQKALQKALDECKAHPDEAFSCFLEYNQDRRPKTIAWQRKAWDLTYPLLAKDQSIDETLISNFYDWQSQNGMLEKCFNVFDLFCQEANHG